MAFHLGSRTRRVIRYLGFFLVSLVVFVFALQMTFPYDRVKDKIIDVLSEKYDVSIGKVERGWVPGRVYFEAIQITTRPTSKDETATTFMIRRLEVDLGLLALVKQTASVYIDAQIAAGHLSGRISLSKDGTKLDLEGSNLPGAALPMKEIIALPISTGKLDFNVELDLPNNANKAGKVGPDWTKAEGRIDLGCPSGCTIGDGKTKIHPKLKNTRNQAFAEGGIDFGTIVLESLAAKVVIKDGRLELTKFETKSLDGEAHIDFSVTLAQEFSESLVAGCLRFKGTPVLEKREPKTAAALATTGAPLGPDGLFHIRLDGKFKEMKRLGQVCGQAADKPMDDPGRHTPGLPPPEAPKPTTAAAPPPPPPATTFTPVDAAVTPDVKPPGPEHEENAAAGSGSAEGSAPAPGQ